MRRNEDITPFTTLALRYLDGAAGPSDVTELEQLLLRSAESRRQFLEIASQEAVLSDFFRVERCAAAAAATVAAESMEWDRESKGCAMVAQDGSGDQHAVFVSRSSARSTDRRSLAAVAAAAGAAAMVALSGLVLWWAAEPPPIANDVLPEQANIGDSMDSMATNTFAIFEGGGFNAGAVLDPEDLPLAEWEAPAPTAHARFLFHSNALTFWSICRAAAKMDARQAFSPTLFGMAKLEFTFEPYTFSRNEIRTDWTYPRLPF